MARYKALHAYKAFFIRRKKLNWDFSTKLRFYLGALGKPGVSFKTEYIDSSNFTKIKKEINLAIRRPIAIIVYFCTKAQA
jgi:hypothetical protein